MPRDPLERAALRPASHAFHSRSFTSVQPPTHAVARAGEHADGDGARRGSHAQRRGDRPADDGGRAPLRIARRAERQRRERDELERRADEQPVVASPTNAPATVAAPAGARSSSAES